MFFLFSCLRYLGKIGVPTFKPRNYPTPNWWIFDHQMTNYGNKNSESARGQHFLHRANYILSETHESISGSKKATNLMLKKDHGFFADNPRHQKNTNLEVTNLLIGWSKSHKFGRQRFTSSGAIIHQVQGNSPITGAIICTYGVQIHQLQGQFLLASYHRGSGPGCCM